MPSAGCWAMAESGRALSAVLLPLAEQNLLVPAAVVAEVVDYVQPEPEDSWPSWVLGVFPWHGRMLPLVSVQAAMGLPTTPAQVRRARIVVLHTLGGEAGLPRYALLVTDTPRVISIWPEFVHAATTRPAGEPYVRQRVSLPDAESAIIPDLDALQGDVLAVIEGRG